MPQKMFAETVFGCAETQRPPLCGKFVTVCAVLTVLSVLRPQGFTFFKRFFRFILLLPNRKAQITGRARKSLES
jgi:hypothetical protein